MQILLKDNKITAYATVGGIEGAITCEGELPENFAENFKPYFYMLENNRIIENPDYEEPKEPELEQASNKPSEIDLLKNEIAEMKKMLNEIKGGD